MNKKRVVSTLFLYLLIFSLGCDFESPQKWETPSWYLPLTVPLINTVYSFEGLVDDSMMVADPISDVIQIVFSDSLPANGLPDSIFNINMAATEIEIPDMELGTGGPIDIPPIPDSTIFQSIEIQGLGIEGLDCFPVSLLSELDLSFPDFSGAIPLDIEAGNELVEVRNVVIVQGNWETTVGNNLPFKVNVDFSITNGGEVLYTTGTSLHDIVPYEPAKNASEEITTTSPEIIDLRNSLVYLAAFSIVENQQPPDNCPDPTNPPVYSCNGSGIFFEDTCQGLCDPDACGVEIEGATLPGWIINPDSTQSLNISFGYEFIKIGSVVAHLAEINKQVNMGKEIPGFEGVSIKSAKIAEATEEYPNKLFLDITNNFFAPFILQFDFINFYHEVGNEWEYLSKNITIAPYDSIDSDKPNGQVDFSKYVMAQNKPDTQDLASLDSMAFNVIAQIDSGLYDILVINDQITVGAPKFNLVKMENMSLEYIAAITDSLEFPSIDSPPIEGIPDGFSDFEFYDIIMEIEFFNEIGIPIGLDMELSGIIEGIIDTKKVIINTEIGAPYGDYYNCSFAITGDTARTLIRIDKDYQITEYYCNTTDTDPSQIDIDTLDSEQYANRASIVDLMNFAPEIISVGGGVVIDGEGILSPGADIWGTFTLIVPLAFVFKKPINIIPAEPTPMAPMDPATSQQIDSALVEAALYVTITNNSPLGGNLSLLISDSTIFPLFLDSLTTGSWDSQLFNFNTAIWDTLDPPMVIDSISFTAIDPIDEKSKALEVKFYNEDSLQFFIGRMFELGFPRADSIEYHLGYANPEFPNIHTSDMVIDTTRMAWVITEEPRYNIAMMTFDRSPIQSITGTDTAYIPLTFQTTNTIGVQAYLTLTLDTGGLGRETNSNDK